MKTIKITLFLALFSLILPICFAADAVEIGSPSDLLEINEVIGNVRETLTEVDLDMLQGGQITTNLGSTDYNQYLRFMDNNNVDRGKVIFDPDERDRLNLYVSRLTDHSHVTYTRCNRCGEGVDLDVACKIGQKVDCLRCSYSVSK